MAERHWNGGYQAYVSLCNKSSQMKLVDADTLRLFARIFITQYKYRIIAQIHTNI